MSGTDEPRSPGAGERMAADLEAARQRLQETIPPPDDGAAPAGPAESPEAPAPRRRQGGLLGRARRLLGRERP